ncbi:undecaprenyldiphospho-muramoylpentapeptide beta-N-acetylglucosaminyltransferase [Candidatus Kuenenbacteria bacterium HGW-Kuenenbacteria-1]|uniref:UDP-N-acetylglucosamine--N-acetylmuramyl-(pentapeptide) pyrophosphoryl-undecaprenol N-acetylglucosamine transferase n=1 Tax=Candidatus Kuenenbacteria bacterium HGW-Kuenenbacteria-1 TaxID=2013812 RepID=A0A2N1UNU1_9BACT|nr:MAG: undecaprenyldiphospho-muramoylpentapeptide beta-N-acetylglucosaminyltransferase [Candidatus Kuenenbacteria bacterium HGW-Kuenenbacteria-1]
MKILLCGGGTMGSVSPLLAIAEEIKKQNNEVQFLWLGTKNGPEKKVIENYKIPFKEIFFGKLRRYFSWQNFIDIFKIKIAFFQSFFIILKFKPNIILSAGSFVAVPVIWAGWLLHIPCLIHQLDIRPTLANKLTSSFVKKITTTFEKSLKDFPKKKTIWTGNPIRQELQIINYDLEIKKAREFFSLKENLPTILIIGGGTGALDLNKIIIQTLPKLTEFCQIIHLTGGKIDKNLSIQNYHAYDFLIKKIKDAYLVADLVISRAGIGTLTELSYFKKPSILIPMPQTHQEENAQFFKNNQATIVLDQNELIKDPNLIIKEIRKLLPNKKELQSLSENIGKLNKQNAEKKIVEIIKNVILNL